MSPVWLGWFLVTVTPEASGAAGRCALPSMEMEPAARAVELWQAALGAEPCAGLAARELGHAFPLGPELAARISAALAEPATRGRASRALVGAAACAQESTWLRAALELLALPVAAEEQEELGRQVRQAVLAADCSAYGGDPAARPAWLLELAAHPQEDVALLAVTLLGHLRPTGATIAGLLRELSLAKTARQRAVLFEALAQAGAGAYPALAAATQALGDDSPAVRRAAIAVIGSLGPRAYAAVTALAESARVDRDASLRRAAREALARIRGEPLAGPLRSRPCLRALRPPPGVCCEPECPRWADLGTRATLDLDQRIIAGVGVRPADGGGGRGAAGAASAVALATTAWRRFVGELLRGGVDQFLRAGPVPNRLSMTRRRERDLNLVEDPDRRVRTEAVVEQVVRSMTPEVLASAGERAVLVGVTIDALAGRLRAQSGEARRSADYLAAYLESIVGGPPATVALPDWVQTGTGWRLDAAGAVFHALGAAYGDHNRLGQGAADRRALDLLVGELGAFADALVAEGGARPGWRALLVTEAPLMVAGSGQIVERWHDADEGRWYALAQLDLSDYLTLLAATADVPPVLRRYVERHAARVFGRETADGRMSVVNVLARAPAAVSAGRVWPLEGRLSGAVVVDAQGQLFVAGEREQGFGLWRLSATEELSWRGKAGGWQALAAIATDELEGWGATLLAASAASQVLIAGLDEEGEPRWQVEVALAGWAAVSHLVPTSDRGLLVALTDEGGARFGERRAALVRVERDGCVAWSYSLSGRGETRIADLFTTGDGGVILFADALFCLDPQADSGCGADPYCEWDAAHSRCAWNKTLVRLSRQGRVVWHQRLKLAGRAAAVAARPDGGSWLLTAGQGEVIVARTDSRGALTWQKRSRLPLAATPLPSLCLLGADDLLVVGTKPTGDLLTVRLDGVGNVSELVSYGGRGRDAGRGCAVRDEAAWVIGESDSLDLPGADPHLANGLYRLVLPVKPD